MADADAQRQVGVLYFRQGIPCPFLDGESCSIHPHRPLSCREYLATSPADHCSTPEQSKVERVELPGKVSHALYRFGDGSGSDAPRWVPLLFALDWVAQHPDAHRRRRRGPRLFEAFLCSLAGGRRPLAEQRPMG
jgi:Fe-S-cluster containining protein